MAPDIFERKVYFVVGWRGKVVSDDIFQTLRGKSASDKGKKVKLTLSRQGLHIRNAGKFQGSSLLNSYRMENILLLAVNQETKSCLFCILRDPTTKYGILAFRCYSDLDAGLFVQHFNDFKKNVGDGSYEMKRVGDGNWTLRGLRSATRPHLQMPSKTPTGMGNGTVGNAGEHHSELNHVTVIQNPDTITTEDMLRKVRQREHIGVQTTHHHVDIDQMSEASDMSSFKDELESLSQELRDIKILLEKTTGISVEEHIRRAKETEVAQANGHVSQHPHPDGVARVYVSNRPAPLLVPSPLPVYIHRDAASPQTTTIKTADVANVLTREFSNGEEQAQRVMAVPHPHGVKPRTSVRSDVVDSATNGVSEGTMSGRNSLRVKFDSGSMRVPNDHRSRSMRIKSDFMVPSTVERSIEKTYARPTILKHGRLQDSIGRPVRRARPQSVYLISGVKPVRIHHSINAHEAQF